MKTTNEDNTDSNLKQMSGFGSGFGKKDFKSLTNELGLDPDEARQRLQSAGITNVKNNQTLGDIGMTNHVSPRDVFNILVTGAIN